MADDCIIRVPLGTVVRSMDSGVEVADLVTPDQCFIAAHGGRGGRGNARFKSPTKQAPRYAQPGEPGETRWLTLELKLLADVGLMGLPECWEIYPPGTHLGSTPENRPISIYHSCATTGHCAPQG